MTDREPRVLNKGNMYARIPDGARLVGRTTRFGNPFLLGEPEDDVERAQVIGRHREWLLTSDEPMTVGGRTYDPSWVRAHVSELRGLDLVCPGNCKPKPCHADVLLELANA